MQSSCDSVARTFLRQRQTVGTAISGVNVRATRLAREHKLTDESVQPAQSYVASTAPRPAVDLTAGVPLRRPTYGICLHRNRISTQSRFDGVFYYS